MGIPRIQKGRRPKSRPLPPDSILTALVKSADDPVPVGPDLLRLVVDALLSRVARKDPHEGRFLRGLIQAITAIEKDSDFDAGKGPLRLTLQRNHVGADPRFSLYRDLTRAIAYLHPPRRSSHDPRVIWIQEALLSGFLREHPYTCHTNDRWWLWASQYWNDLRLLLTVVPCWCKYSENLPDSHSVGREALKAPQTEKSAKHLLLAHLHDVTPDSINRHLKRQPSLA
ncbi:MAG: hypothetical protein OJF50_006748 [Nitrospira sp.]|jgi:hypothetical protein|nr:hypothetical protein [Nitrospira sp.]